MDGSLTTSSVALVGHAGTGKTTLAEALLHRAGVIGRPGSVEDGSTVCDHEPEAISHGMSIGLSVATFDAREQDGSAVRLTLLDTPGFVDFVGARDAALAVADLAVLVVSAVDGLRPGDLEVWRECDELGIPRMVFVTKEDKPRADFRAVLAQLKEQFGSGVLPLELPLGEEQGLHGVADVLAEEAIEYDQAGSHREAVPAELAAEEHRLHDEVTEEIVSHDDEALERYLEGSEPTIAELERSLAHEVRDCEAFPVLLGSATTGVGVDRLLHAIASLGTIAPARSATVLLDGTVHQVEPDPEGQPLVRVFRVVADPFLGQVALFKVLSGAIHANDRLVDVETGAVERLHGLFALQGKKHIGLDRVVAGDVAAVAKLSHAASGTLLAGSALPLAVVPGPARPAMHALAVEPATHADDDKLLTGLTRLCQADPTLVVTRELGQTVLRGLGDLHLGVALERLERAFGVRVQTEPVRIAYCETIVGPADVEGRLKKQSGGHGQFAVVRVRVTPLPRASGIEFVDSVVGGSVPRQYIPAVERGVREAAAQGGPHGHEVVDVRVELYEGRAHSVDSSEAAFRTAGSLALREALASAGSILLEPISAITVSVPDWSQGDVLGDIAARRGRITASDVDGHGNVRIEALVPSAELARYVLDLRSLTAGEGTYDARQEGYEVAPGNLVGA